MPLKYYVDAFSPLVTPLWASVFPERVTDLCYRSLIGAFRDSSEVNITLRQDALYCLLKGAFSFSRADDPLNQYRNLLPTKNWVAKGTSALCTAYGEDPNRVFSTNTSVNKLLGRYYKEGGANTEFRWAHEQATLQNMGLVRPYFNWRNKCQFQTVLPDSYHIKWHATDIGRMAELWIAIEQPGLYNANGRAAFQVWTETDITYYDVYGERVGVPLANNYGVIPFVPLQMQKPRDNYDRIGGGMYSLVYANLIDNAIQWSALNSVLFNSFSIWISTNIDWGGQAARINPGGLVVIKNAKAGTQTQPILPPNLESVGADGQYTMINELGTSVREDELFDLGIPDFLASRRANVPTTATEQILKAEGLNNKRKADLPVLADFEVALAEMVCIVARVDQHETGLPLFLPDMTTDFAEIRVVQDVEKEFAFDAGLVISGLTGVEKFLAKWEGLDEIPTEEKAIEIMSSRQERYKDILKNLANVVGVSKPPAPASPPASNPTPPAQPGNNQPPPDGETPADATEPPAVPAADEPV